MTAMMASCGGKKAAEPVLEKHDVAIVDGHFTPEIMHQLGKISDLQVSPDGQKILYGVAYTSIEENRSNRNLFVMNIDGSSNERTVWTMDKFTMPDDKCLVVELAEKNGGRNQQFVIENSDLVRAKLILELQVK